MQRIVSDDQRRPEPKSARPAGVAGGSPPEPPPTTKPRPAPPGSRQEARRLRRDACPGADWPALRATPVRRAS
jgi:hypothetical protein